MKFYCSTIGSVNVLKCVYLIISRQWHNTNESDFHSSGKNIENFKREHNYHLYELNNTYRNTSKLMLYFHPEKLLQVINEMKINGCFVLNIDMYLIGVIRISFPTMHIDMEYCILTHRF